MTARRRGYEILRDAVIVAGVALIVFQAARRYVGDYYRVPSGSMEPMLYGDAASGDVVWVDAWSTADDCGRGDVVVVQHPEDPDGQLVKRIVADGDDLERCWVDFSGGDVFLGDNPQQLQREVKDPARARRMRVRWGGWPGSAADRRPLIFPRSTAVAVEPDAAAGATADPAVGAAEVISQPALTIDAATLQQRCARRAGPRRRNGSDLPRGFAGTRDPVDASYIDATGRRSPEGADVQVLDCGLDLRLFSGVEQLALVLETRFETMTWLLDEDGAVALWRDGVEVAAEQLAVGADAARRVEFGRLDERYFLIVDGRADATFIEARRSDWRLPRERLPRGPRTRLAIAALGTRPLAIAELEVFRDIYHYRNRVPGNPDNVPSWPKHTAPGEWFLVGDNAFDSHDSRQFGALPAATYRGRPRFVLGPWPRRRWLLP